MKLTILLCLLAVMIGWCVPTPIAVDVGRLLVPAIALLATGIFPSMTLVVNAMKAEERTPNLIDQLYAQLHMILRVLVTTFALAAISIAALATLSVGGGEEGFVTTSPWWAQKAFLIFVCLLIALLIGRVMALGRVFFAILEVNRTQALIAARSKNKKSWDAAMSKMEIDVPEDYAASVGPLHELH
ncbi:hypothetical protein DM806_12845 [Sphingobium lactosutens]|uniref:hypothetical protein n=1 Tax=Sphingobium lactosutens TaxID=522773 RepID=UPI0015B9A76D|nr:hypothetical protein [Sphingobium lactosutens]NWK96532.1 hypothetical protein [Sphingobium lactosutens]